MKIETKVISNLRKEIISVGQGNPDISTGEIKEGLVLQIEQMKSKIKNKIISIRSESQARRFVQEHQSYVIRMCNLLLIRKQLLSGLPEEKKQVQETAEEFYNTVFGLLTDLLSYLENYYGAYFDQNAPVPEGGKIEALDKYVAVIENTNCRFICKLRDIAIKPLKEVVQKKAPLSFHKINYLKEHIECVHKNCQGCQSSKCNCSLRQSLFYNNFNHSDFIYDYKEHIIGAYDKKNLTTAQNHNILRNCFGNLMRLPINANKVFEPGMPSIKKELISWFRGEFDYLERKALMERAIPEGGHTEEELREKMEVTISVSQIALLSRFAIDTKLVSLSKTELLKIISKHIKTKEQDNISPGSLYRKYYSSEEKDVKAVKKFAIQMMNYLSGLEQDI